MKTSRVPIPLPSLPAACLLATLLMAAAPWAFGQTKAPSKVSLQVTVNKVVARGFAPEPFPAVGLFEIQQGAAAMPNACPAASNSIGTTRCRIDCDPNDTEETTLLVAAPDATRVRGYESPLAQELVLVGCKLQRSSLAFTYRTIDVAFAEVAGDPQVAQAISGKADGPVPTLSALPPFEQSAPRLQALAASGNPNFDRLARILRDAAVSQAPQQGAKGANPPSRAAEYSVGTRSIQLHEAARRSLGAEFAPQLVPITTDNAKLQAARESVVGALQRKADKSPFDRALETEIGRAPQNKGAIDWQAVNRTQRLEQRRRATTELTK